MAKNAMFTQQELSEFDNRVAHIHVDGRSRQDDPADAMDFDAWLNSPEGIAWLDCEAERYAPNSADYGYRWERPA